MDNFLIIALIVVAIAIVYFVIKSYKIRFDTILAFTGGLGSGKSFLSVHYSLKLLKKQRLKVRLQNLFKKRSCKAELPLLYTNIPVLIDKNRYAIRLTASHLLLQEKLIPKSVCLLDEVDSFASQFDYGNNNIKDTFNEFVRLYRHYTLGGYLVVNSQCSENIVLQIRRRINTVFNLMQFQTFLIFYRVKIRAIDISEEIKSVSEDTKEESFTFKYGILPLNRHYDTYCYSERYNTVPYADNKNHVQLKTNVLTNNPKDKKEALTTSIELASPRKKVKSSLFSKLKSKNQLNVKRKNTRK